jgi:hypothetical protein
MPRATRVTAEPRPGDNTEEASAETQLTLGLSGDDAHGTRALSRKGAGGANRCGTPGD